mmetsp:Transcript_33348/g.60089  ORF Transcript_33348/g.60089 Transcript_33348/m.60089 type:complete len:144 (-) Transcript_33348:267-698(-)|eukprot:CAMPEP_0201883758 /NCGR_PEP_ID=MMETSP0902-20130614/16217_1 /ASSEMBLY_ACC=CAM_ASM_000551 /TAXON_ID=420261 /ORGANISM="Thalassiosira antarctica, Strain CCMP982" /LENGTH=143 /DNA_ID=CAMNT_0048412611 /DNA_START=93 /DNA_END=524 /DNA_ORIENTATION=-
MVKSVLFVLSILALASAQISRVPHAKRVRNDNSVVKTSSNRDSAFGRSTSNLRSNINKNDSQQHRQLAMTMDLSMPTTTDDEPAPAPPAPAPEVESPPAKEEVVNCKKSVDCDEGKSCLCRFNCLFCSDEPMLHFDSFCGTCV